MVLFFILLLTEFYFKIIETNNNIKKIIYTGFGILATIFAIWSKETAIVIAVFSIVCLIFSFKNKSLIKKSFWYLICVLFSVFLARIPYYFNEGFKETYTTYGVSIKLVKDNLLYYIKNQPDAFILGILCLVIVSYLGFRKKNNNLLILGGLSRILCKLFYKVSPRGGIFEPLTQLMANPVREQNGEMKQHLSPILDASRPFASDIHGRQIEHLQ